MEIDIGNTPESKYFFDKSLILIMDWMQREDVHFDTQEIFIMGSIVLAEHKSIDYALLDKMGIHLFYALGNYNTILDYSKRTAGSMVREKKIAALLKKHRLTGHEILWKKKTGYSLAYDLMRKIVLNDDKKPFNLLQYVDYTDMCLERRHKPFITDKEYWMKWRSEDFTANYNRDLLLKNVNVEALPTRSRGRM